MQNYELTLELSETPTWPVLLVIVAGILAMILVAVARDGWKATGPDRTRRRRRAVGYLVVALTAAGVGGYFFLGLDDSERTRWQAEEQAAISQRWQLTVADARQLPGLDPAQNVQLDVTGSDGRPAQCTLSSWQHAKNGSRSTRRISTRGQSTRIIELVLACP